MAYELPEKIRNLTPYEPISGNYEIRLDANESYFTLTEEILQELKEEIANLPLSRYPDPYCEALTRKFANFQGVDEKLVTVGNGSDELISVIFGSFLSTGDSILVIKPEFSMYKFYGDVAGAETTFLDKNQDMEIETEKVCEYIKQHKPNMVIFSNPCNPTSVGASKEDVRKIISASETGLVVLDEAYMDFWGEGLVCEADKYDNLIVLKTASKAIGLAGVRLGFAIANEKITTALKAVKSPYNVNAITQKVGEIVYSYPEILKENIAMIIHSTQKLHADICELAKLSDKIEKVYDTKCNFVFFKTDYADEIFEGLKEKSIVVRNFKKYIRITCGSEAENNAMLSNLKTILAGE